MINFYQEKKGTLKEALYLDVEGNYRLTKEGQHKKARKSGIRDGVINWISDDLHLPVERTSILSLQDPP